MERTASPSAGDSPTEDRRQPPPVSDALLKHKLEAHAEWRRQKERSERLPWSLLQRIGKGQVDPRLRAVFRERELACKNLEGKDLRRARLSGVLDRTRLSGAELSGADLTDADLVGAKGLTACQLAGTDLTRARLPPDISFKGTLESVEEASKSARTLLFGLLAACLYSALTVSTTGDVGLLANSSAEALPVIDALVPAAWFLILVPALLLAVFFYFHIYLQRLLESLADLPAVFQNGRPLDKQAHPWLVNGLVRSHCAVLREMAKRGEKPALSKLQSGLSMLLGWYVVPLTLALVWFRYLSRHERIGTGIQIGLVVFAFASAAYFHYLARVTLRQRGCGAAVASRRARTAAKWIFVAALPLAGLLWLVSDGAIYGAWPELHRDDTTGIAQDAKLRPDRFAVAVDERDAEVLHRWLHKWAHAGMSEGRTASLRAGRLEVPATLSEVDAGSDEGSHGTGGAAATKETEDEPAERPPCEPLPGDRGLQRPFLLRQRDWVPRILSHERLQARADFEHHDAQGAHLEEADLRYARMREADLGQAFLEGARLDRADLSRADLRTANLASACLDGAQLSHADLRTANLTSACLAKADLSYARLGAAKLTSACLVGASFLGADLERADLRGACLMAANLEKGRLEGANLSEAELYAALLSGARLKNANLIRTSALKARFLRADLRSADLSLADLQKADFSSAQMQCAQLTGANLDGTVLFQADLACADLSDLAGIDGELDEKMVARLRQAKNWELASYPPVLDGALAEWRSATPKGQIDCRRICSELKSEDDPTEKTEGPNDED